MTRDHEFIEKPRPISYFYHHETTTYSGSRGYRRTWQPQSRCQITGEVTACPHSVSQTSEDELGIALFSRTSRGVELTDIGERVIGRAPTGPGDIFRQPFIDNGLIPPTALTTSESYFGALSLVETLGTLCTFPSLLLEEMGKHWRIAPIPIAEEIPSLKISLMTRAGPP